MMLGGRFAAAWDRAAKRTERRAAQRGRREGMGIGQGPERREGGVVRVFLPYSRACSRGIFAKVAVPERACRDNARGGEKG